MDKENIYIYAPLKEQERNKLLIIRFKLRLNLRLKFFPTKLIFVQYGVK